MPLFLGRAEASCAEIKAVGMRKNIPASSRKKMRVLPNKAVVGKLRMLSELPVMSMVSVKTVSGFLNDLTDMI